MRKILLAPVASPQSFSGRTQFNGVVQGHPVNEQADIGAR